MAKHQSDLKLRELALREIVREAINAWPEFEDDNVPVDGADMVAWYAQWRERAIGVLMQKRQLNTAARVG